jgi:RNA polymerase sigma-70 factor, ECF subfamily
MAAVEVETVEAPASAAAQLYERHYPRVLSYCLWRLGKREDAEDAAQTTFLNAFQGLARGTRPGSESPWLLTIAQNVCRARWRAERRRPAELLQAPEDFTTLAAAESDPQLLRRLQDALAELPDLQRRSFVLREWQGLSYPEIGERLGTSEAAVASLVFRARRTLIGALSEERPTTRRLHALDATSLLAWLKGLLGGSAAKLAAVGVTVAVATAAAVPVASRSGPVTNRQQARPGPRPAAGARAPQPSAAAQPRTRTVRRVTQLEAKVAPGRGATTPTIPVGNDGPPTAPTPAPETPPASPPTSVPTPPSPAVSVSAPSASETTDRVTNVVDTAASAASQLPLPVPTVPQTPSVPSVTLPQLLGQ